ncbi:S-layer homology domain-containing protein [Flavonifractor porci]|uniref:S-layer homology domain-containing protein n=1 Tax=Flavonifractor porci TaxID=3133422 RepID=UPI0030B70A39
MRHKLKPLLSAILTLAMLLSLLPTAVFAAGETGTFTKITTQEELIDGKYVMVVDSGYAVGALDGTWLTATQVTDETGSLTNPDANLVWDIAVADDGVTLTDANGTQVAPKGGNENGIQTGSYTWAISFENGTFRFLGTGADTVTLASNKSVDNKFRAYKNTTINAGYPCDFTLYKLDGEGGTDPGPTEPETITIADALKAPDDTADLAVKGVVTLVDGKNVYLQDSTGGICVRMSDNFDDIALGDTVIGTGKRATFNGLPQLDGSTYVKSSGLTLTPTVKTISELTTADICTYVTIQNVEVTEVDDNGGKYSNPNITVTDGTNSIELYKAVIEKNKDGAWPVKVGDTITITAAVGVYNTTLQLRNTTAAEIDLGGTPAGPITHGDQVVIYNPAYNKALSATYNGFYNNGVDVAYSNGTLSGFTAAEVWTVADNGDGTWSFSYNSQNIGMGDSFASMPLGEKNDKWVLEDAGNGLWYIKNFVRGAYMEWYAEKNNWSSYYKINPGSESMFALSFYKVTDIPEPPTGDLPKDGDQVVIYNLSAQGVLSGEGDNQVVNNAAATVTDGVATPTNGARVFTVEQKGEWFRFKTDYDGYLCSNGTGNNAFYSKDAADDADWKLEAYNGGFTLESRTAKFNGKYSQFLEYYGGTYKSYSMNKVTDKDIFTFQFYPVSSGVNVTEGVVNAPVVNFGTLPEAYVGQDYTVTFTVDAVFGVADGLTAKYDTTDAVLTNDNGTYSFTIPASALSEGKLTVTVSGTDTKGVSFNGSAEITVKDEPVITDIFPAANAQTGEEKQPEIGFTFANGGETPTIALKVNDQDVTPTVENGKVSYKPAEAMADGKVTVTASITRSDNKKAERTWTFTIGTAQYQLYFGQLHSHTGEYSDGSGTLQQGLDYVAGLPENANVDFVAFTDHSNYFDTSSEANPEAALYDISQMSAGSKEKWNAYTGTIDTFNTQHAGKLVALAGFEMTWSGGPGHINTFNTPGIVSRNNKTLNNKNDDAGLQAYYALLSNENLADSISQFNHPGTTFGNFVDFGYYNAVIDSRMYLVEVGNGEGAIGAGGYYPSYEQYIMALDKGWHVAPTNNQDNHKGRWGNANDARDVVLTDDFSQDGIYEAIRNYRVYATEDKNLEINYTLNGQMLGSTIEEVPETANISVNVYDPDASDSIARVEVVVNSGVVAYTWDDPAQLKTGTLSCAIPADYSYYFIRVTQNDGDLAVTAPVWVGETVKLGISSVTCDTAIPVTGEELTLTTTFFNSEAEEVTVESITYASGDKVLYTDNTGYTLATGTHDVTWNYTPAEAKVMTITVTAVLMRGDVKYTYSKDVTLDVMDADKLVYIGIDASHYNEYVNGNYKDSMGNFSNLAAGYSVRTVQLNTSEELIAACGNAKYKAIILTAPSRRLAEAQSDPKTYSEAELAAIAAFNDAGGMVILAGWSDNYENYDVIQNNPDILHMAAAQNEVLKALGSSLRIGDDATYDDVFSKIDGVDPWRLYFNTYNWDSFLTQGIEYDKDHDYDNMYTQLYSHYGGATVYAVDGTGNAASALPETVTPVVYGHSSTYSKDVDGDGLGGNDIPKYPVTDGDNRLMVLATEDLGGGKGLIVVSGAAFMSNFEVQANLDNGSEKNYSNYNICENLVNYLNPLAVTPIEQVQAEKEENVKFAIEGVITSNASGYDKDTAFFDCIYLQDDTAGINAFPVAGNYKIGDKVRIIGTTSSYQGERQMNVLSIKKIGEEKAPEPKPITTKEAAQSTYLGSLVKLQGVVVSFAESEGLVQTIIVRDKTGYDARVFIDGYITKDKVIENLAVGHEITVTGLASYDNTFNAPQGPFPRIRVRDRGDIVCGTEVVDIPPAYVPPSGGGGGSGSNVPRFTDLDKDAWYYEDVMDVVKAGLMEGVSKTKFGPGLVVNRAMVATILYRLSGEKFDGSADFPDVADDSWYDEAVAWAVDCGIVTGYDSGLFGPDDAVTREQVAVMFYRYWQHQKGENKVGDVSRFSDAGQIGDYAVEAMKWAVGMGLIQGRSSQTLAPTAQACRAELCTMLNRMLKLS